MKGCMGWDMLWADKPQSAMDTAAPFSDSFSFVLVFLFLICWVFYGSCIGLGVGTDTGYGVQDFSKSYWLSGLDGMRTVDNGGTTDGWDGVMLWGIHTGKGTHNMEHLWEDVSRRNAQYGASTGRCITKDHDI